MSNRKIQIVVLVCLLLGVVSWMFYAFTPSKTDEARYLEMRHTSRSISLALSAENGRLGIIVRLFHMLLHIPDRYFKQFDAQREELLASGYLTNISITVSNATSRRGQLTRQLTSVTEGWDILRWHLSWQSNGVAVTCRPQDEVRLRHALGQ
jgi:hypothetical protein